MSKKLIYLLLAVSLGLNAGVISMTLIHKASRGHQGPPPGPPEGRGREQKPPRDPERLVEDHLRRISRHLGLDQEQQQAIRDLLERYTPQLTSLQSKVEETSRRLTEAYAEPVFDTEQFQQLVAEASAARVKLDSLSAVMLVAEAAILTPEQRQQFAEVAPSIHSQPKRPPGEGGPPPR